MGITHQAELLGFNEPVIIENLAPASVASSEPIFAAPQPIPALVVRPPSEVFGAHPAPSLPVTYVFDFYDFTRNIPIEIMSIHNFQH